MNFKSFWLSVDGLITSGVRWFVYLAAASGGVMMLLAVTDVIGAKFFHHGILGAGEMIEELNIVLVFMAIAYVQAERGHIRITFLERYMSSGIKYALISAGQFLGVFIFGFLSWRALTLFQKHITVLTTKEGAVSFILWPFSLTLTVGLVLLTIVFLRDFIKGMVTRPDDSMATD